MNDINKRLEALSREKRELLELKLKERGIHVSLIQKMKDKKSGESKGNSSNDNARKDKNMKFSIFYFTSEFEENETEKYKFILETTKFADDKKFEAVWFPERHFQQFGGLFPNPSILASAVTSLTKNVQLRAGSVVLPLHHPLRVAEEWSVIDNLSGGRVGLSFAAGWNSKEFLLNPHNYDDRKNIMLQGVESIKKLWAGETLSFKGVNNDNIPIKLIPPPVNRFLETWITSSGNPETWIDAGKGGHNVLGALIGQSLKDIEFRIKIYRDALESSGYDRNHGKVSIMLHTFIGDSMEYVRDTVKEPMYRYLDNFMKQDVTSNTSGNDLLGQTYEELLKFSLERYFGNSSLLGTPEKVTKTIDMLQEIGVDECACLIDFGLTLPQVLESLEKLSEIKALYENDDSRVNI